MMFSLLIIVLCFYVDLIHNMFTIIKYSEKGKAKCFNEEATYIYFVKCLDESEKGRNQ